MKSNSYDGSVDAIQRDLRRLGHKYEGEVGMLCRIIGPNIDIMASRPEQALSNRAPQGAGG